MTAFTMPDVYAVPLLVVIASGFLSWAAWSTKMMSRISAEMAHLGERQVAAERLHAEIVGQLASLSAQMVLLADKVAAQGARIERIAGFNDGVEHARAEQAYRDRSAG